MEFTGCGVRSDGDKVPQRDRVWKKLQKMPNVTKVNRVSTQQEIQRWISRKAAKNCVVRSDGRFDDLTWI